MSTLQEQALQALEKHQARNAPYEARKWEDRRLRGLRRFRDAFKTEPASYELEGKDDKPERVIVTTEDGLRLRYVGGFDNHDKPTYTGGAFVVMEACAKCKLEQPVKIVRTLKQLGEWYADPPEWECVKCNRKQKS